MEYPHYFQKVGRALPLISMALASLASPQAGAADNTGNSADELVLRYDSPAAKWRESLPLGNGHLGVTVSGGLTNERLQLSENSIYSGGWGTRVIDPLEAEFIKHQRAIAVGGDVDAAMALTFEEFKKNWQGEHPDPVEIEGFCRVLDILYRPVEQTMGDLDLFFPAHDEIVEDYERKLDLRRSVATTKYRVGDVHFTREAFCSYPDDVTVMKLSSSEKGQISFSAQMSRPTDVLEVTRKRNLSGFIKHMVSRGVPAEVDPVTFESHGNDTIMITGRAFNRGTQFTGALKVTAKGGTVSIEGNRIHVEGADEATLFIAGTTDYYHGEDWQDDALATLEAAAAQPYQTLLDRHMADYKKIFDRVEFSLGTSRPAGLPTDVRLDALDDEFDFGGADRDPQLYALYFHFGRYLLISSSRKGYFPPGYIYWCPDLLSEWLGGHATDINQQMNYWFADTCDMPEVLAPFFDVLDSYVPAAKEMARYQYGSRGMMMSGFTVFGQTGPKKIWPALPNTVAWPAGTGWFAQHYWEHYRFTQDEAFLRNRAYPFIKESALFYLDYLAEDPETGNLVSFPDVSPEGEFFVDETKKETRKYDVGTTFTLSVCREVFTNFIQASTILGLDEDIRAEAEQALLKIKPYKIGRHGQLQEWQTDYERTDEGHRHLSHLYPIYPGYEITPDNHPVLAEAARKSLERRRSHVDISGYVSWHRAWMMSLFARLREPELAHEEAKISLAKCTYPNLLGCCQMGRHDPDRAVNTIDGNFGYTAGVVEMLLQSHQGEIHLLPALPTKRWPDGHIRGLKARGGYGVDIEWAGGQLKRAVIRPEHDGICALRYGDTVIQIPVKAGVALSLNGNLKPLPKGQ